MKNVFVIVFLLSLIGGLVRAVNFFGHQSLNGLQTTQIFTAPAPGIYFVNGQLSLPQPNSNGNTGYSQVVAVVSKNYATAVYTGVAGASGFQLNALTLATGDLVTVGLSSAAAVDQVTNAVRGDVYYGNAF